MYVTKKMSEACFVCCEKFDQKNKKKIKCHNPSGGYSACKTCTRSYLLNNANDIHCMNCRQAWDQTFVIINLNRCWFENVYLKHRRDLLFEKEQSKFPETMNEVEKYNQIKNEEKKKIENRKKIALLMDQVRLIENNNREIDTNIRFIKTGQVAVERQKFTMPCQKEDCKGFLSTSYKCGVCQDYCCSKCLTILGPDKNIAHTCNENDVANAEYIKNTTKACPKCGQRIHKISGCDQMWCTECHTSFSWKSGQIINGVIHNPHYFQYMRNNNNGNVPRQPGDNPCADVAPYLNIIIQCIHKKIYNGQLVSITPHLTTDNPGRSTYNDPRHIYTKRPTFTKEDLDINTWKKDEFKEFTENSQLIMEYIRLFRHIEYAELPEIRNTITRCEDNVNNRVQFMTNEIDKNKFTNAIIEKDITRSKYVDLLYIYDLIVNVGNDTVKKIFEIIDNKMHLSRQDIQHIIFSLDFKDIENTFKTVVESCRKFIQYCNQQFDIISVSHNCRSKQFQYLNRRTYYSLRHITPASYLSTDNINLPSYLMQLSGYINLKDFELKGSKKSTIKAVKEYYSKS